jgi:hypothetical protein
LSQPDDELLYFDSEPILAWRCWRLGERRGKYRLLSITYPIAWRPLRPLRAHCVLRFKSGGLYANTGGGSLKDEDHGPAPERRHNCGIYGVKTPKQVDNWSNEKQGFVSVVGVVALWGRVLLHDGGYKAECAYPKALFPVVEQPKPAGAPLTMPMNDVLELLSVYEVPVSPVFRHRIPNLTYEGLS